MHLFLYFNTKKKIISVHIWQNMYTDAEISVIGQLIISANLCIYLALMNIKTFAT